MSFKRKLSLIFFMLFSIGVFALDVPIIFVHEQKSEGVPLKWNKNKQRYVGGWTTWYSMNPDGSLKHPTAMTKIIGYKGSQYGLKVDDSPAITCDININTESSSKSDDLWIPPGLYNEPSYIGCCLFSFGAGLVGYEIYKSLKDTTKKEYYPKFSIGIGYSPGIAYRGVLSRLLESGEMDPFHQFYWNNQVHLNLSIPVTTVFFTKLSGSYIWAKIGKTGALNRAPEGYFWPDTNSWKFNAYSCGISIGSLLKQNSMVEVGIEYYGWEGECKGHQIYADTFKAMTSLSLGKGFCGIVGIGIDMPVLNSFFINTKLIVRWSKGSESYSSSEIGGDFTPVVLHLTGVYIDIGIEYVSKNKMEGGPR